MKEINNDKLRERLGLYHDKYPISYIRIGIDMGLKPENARYVLSRFMRNMIELNDETQSMLDDYLSKRGY